MKPLSLSSYRTGLSAAVLAILVFSCFGLSAQATEAPPDSLKLEQLVPAETILLVKCSGVNELLEDSRSLDLMKIWAEEEVQAFFADLKAMIPKMLEGGGEGWDFPFKEVWNLFKGEVSVAFTGRMTIFQEGAAPSTAIAADMGGNKEAFMGTINGMMDMLSAQAGLERGSFEYRGFDIHFIGMPKRRLVLCYTTMQNLFLTTLNRYFMQDIIDCRLDEKPVLAGVSSFAHSLERVGGKAVDAIAFLNLKPLLNVVEPLCPYEIKEWVDMLGLAGIDAVCLASTIEGGGARDSLFINCPGEKKGLMKAIAPHPVSFNNIRRTPQDAIYFADMVFDPELLMKEIDHFVQKAIPEYYGEFRGGLEMMKRETGFDLERDILAPIGSEVSFYVGMSQTGGMTVIPDMILSVALDDEQGFLHLLNRVLAMAEGEIQISESNFKGKTLRHFSMPHEGMPIAPTFTIEEGCLLFAASPITLKKHLNWIDKGGPGLDQSPAFREAMAGLPEGVSGLEYVDLRRLVEMGYGAAAPFIPALLAEADLPLDPGLLPMTETISQHISNAMSYMAVDEDGIIMSGRSSLGLGAILSLTATTMDYMVENDLLKGMLARSMAVSRGRPVGLPGGRIIRSAESSSKKSEIEAGRELMQTGQYGIAEQLFSSWIKKHPEDSSSNMVTALLNRGYCRLAQKRYKEGASDYKKVVELSPEQRGLAYYNLTCAASCLNEKDKAITYLEKAIDSGWDDFEHMADDPDMDNIRNDPRYKALLKREF
jgi:tetratricopeptide (TPR) repeat protein